MTASAFVRRYVYQLKDGQVFSTREVLHLGSRTSIDQALRDLVKKGMIVRLARGVYRRGDDTLPLPAPLEVATVKATAYGKDLSIHGDDLLAQLNLSTPQAKSKVLIFWVDGGASSFRYGDTKIVFKPASARKIQLIKKGGPALSLVALWHMGKKRVTRMEVSLSATYNNHERQKLKQSLNSVPQWLSKFYVKETDGLHQYLPVEEYWDQLHGQSQLSFDSQHA
ncbi:MAG: type IV toxin-antitoxin system AbiEi family antitoxin domain-containing protein [Candidatus Melainabacteria bacterium]|nr:type IV toxin-antitoxin system AbiEi family antitoxin domain-containing protein [Candidatus Melainabacteria bacterium]